MNKIVYTALVALIVWNIILSVRLFTVERQNFMMRDVIVKSVNRQLEFEKEVKYNYDQMAQFLIQLYQRVELQPETNAPVEKNESTQL